MPTFKNPLPENIEYQVENMNTFLDADFKRTKKQYDIFDAIDNNKKLLLECKHRTINYARFPDTIIGVNKYIEAKKKYPDYDFYATFLFTDGMYCYKFDNNKTIEEQGIFTTTKKYNKYLTSGYVKEHMNIPINLLKFVCKNTDHMIQQYGELPKGRCLIKI